MGIGAFKGFLNLWDWVTAGDSLVSIVEHLPGFIRFVSHPLSTPVILVAGYLLLWLATKDSPKAVLLYGPDYHNPLPTKKHPVLRLVVQSVGIAALLAVLYVVAYSRTTRAKPATSAGLAATPTPPQPRQVAPPPQSSKAQVSPKPAQPPKSEVKVVKFRDKDRIEIKHGLNTDAPQVVCYNEKHEAMLVPILVMTRILSLLASVALL